MTSLNLLILSELIVVVLIWTCLSAAVLYPVDSVRQALPDVWLDESIELRIIGSLLSVALELYAESMLVDVMRGLRLPVKHARRWADSFRDVWMAQAVFFTSPEMGAKWLGHYLAEKLLAPWFNCPRESPVRSTPPDTQLGKYSYKRFSRRRALRLITICPHDGAETDPIFCSMKEFPLDSLPEFTALSYAWDAQDGFEAIVCDGALVTVTKNCVAALRNIRTNASHKRNMNRYASNKSTHRDEKLWVDAICINQEDLSEKNYQIGIMGTIYKTAAAVHVWLGEHDDSSRRVCDYFMKISGIDPDDPYAIRDSEQSANKVGLDIARSWPQLTKSMVDWFGRSWFTRAWPIQEVTLAQPGRVTVVCGNVHLKLEYIRHGWDVLRELGVVSTSSSLDEAVALQFYLSDAISLKRGHDTAVRPSRWENGKELKAKPVLTDLAQFSFVKVMNSMRCKGCRDPKDRFFSLYGVFEELEIEHDIDISMWSLPDAEVFKAVALACFKLGGSLDAIRLAQLPDPYTRLSDSLRCSAKRNPYDGLSASLFAMTGRVCRAASNAFRARDVCYDPDLGWRSDLPSWVPDWTQPISGPADPAYHISLLNSPTSPPALQSTEFVRYEVHGSYLDLVDAQILGHITEIGTIDPVKVFWQSIMSNPLSTSPNRNSPTPDPISSALFETTINLLWQSQIPPIFVSIQMAFRTLDIFDVMAYASAAYTSYTYFTARLYQVLCMRFPSVASCPTDGHHIPMKAEHLSEVHALNQAFGIFIKGRMWINRDMWRQSVGDILFTLGGVLWKFRVSIVETLLAGMKYDDLPWFIVLPIMGRVISASTQLVATWTGDASIFLLAWSFGAFVNVASMAAFSVWTWKVLVLPILGMVTFRLCRSPTRVLWSLTGRYKFREAGLHTQGMNFFVADTGVTGSTGGPVVAGDCVAVIRGLTGHLILRRREKGYVVVGGSFVGAAPELTTDFWTKIRLY